MKIFKKPSLIFISTIGATIALSAIVGTTVGIKSYWNSYYSILNKKPAEYDVIAKSAISKEDFEKIVSNLQIKPNFAKISAKTALNFAKNKLYQLDLSSAFDFGALQAKGYKIAFDFSDAIVDGQTIKNVVIFAKSDKDFVTFSHSVVLKGFAITDKLDGDLNKFLLDSSKSFIDVSKAKLTQLEFKKLLNEKFKAANRIDLFLKLSQALIDTNSSLSLFNSLDVPVFLGDSHKLEPILNEQNQELTFKNKENKLYLGLKLKDLVKKTSLDLDLEIRGFISNQEIASELALWFETNLKNKIDLKQEVQSALIKDKITLEKYLYGKKTSATNTETVVKNKNFADIFNLRTQKKFIVPTNSVGTLDVDVTFSLANDTKIAANDKEKLLANKKIRFEIRANISRNQIEIAKELPIFVDLNIEFNKYEQVLDSIFGISSDSNTLNLQPNVNKVKVFSIPKKSGSQPLSSNEIRKIIAELYQLAENPGNLENPTDEVISKIYLLDNGKYPNSAEKEAAKAKIKAAIAEAKKNSFFAEKPANNSETIAKDKQSKPSTEKNNSNQNTETKVTNAKNVTVTSFSDPATSTIQSQNNSANSAIGTSIWTAINAPKIYNFKDAVTKYSIDFKNTDLVINFQIVSLSDTTKVLASSQFLINNTILSEKSAYDVIKKYNPSVFLEPNSVQFKEYKGSEYKQLADYLNRKIIFKSTNVTKTSEGLEIKKALKLEESPIRRTSGSTSITQSRPSLLNSGAIYLAFSAKDISDKKQHYILSDKYGKGIFIQKMTTKSLGNKDFFVIGMDFKQVSGFFSLRKLSNQSESEKKNGNLFIPLKNFKTKYQQQILVTSGFPKKTAETTSSSSTTHTQTSSSDSITNFIVNPHSNFYAHGIISTSGSENSDNNAEKTPKMFDFVNNIYFRQNAYSPKDVFETVDNEFSQPIEENANILLEIIKTPYSIKVSLYSSNSKNPKNYKEVGEVFYNIDNTGTWSPFPNFFDLDWNQIGPNPSIEPVENNDAQNQGKKAEGAQNQGKKSEGAQNQGKKSEGAQNQGKKSEGAQNQGKKSEGAQNQAKQTDELSDKSTITLKAFAAFNDPKFTTSDYEKSRGEILDAFIKSYIEK
ncbi:P110/LppT family adhesin N-terminal domain [Mycoplasma sp. 'Moose RK']|uniref:P110/LppT family adhesin N-terminal domain n=1 Tax=Mycoplasma sp. 'Moose RK' TaxID=2780095 RepID=UPI0018C31599|nr:P110/LppT family adhesin N-terminal domain [Mycoplasma sp. 'Moose RK']MBG0730724.1 P110/LppT family adhesin N-terminal domain [Mycoplasma sp. 'Moose RK']